MLSFVGHIFATKMTIISELTQILKHDDFCRRVIPYPTRIQALIDSLIDDITFVLEYPYVDRHFRDTYYNFYSSKFAKMGRNCIRVHIFKGVIDENELFLNGVKTRDKYLGFYIVRPILRFPLGRSLISPKALKSNNFICCIMKSRVTLFGKEFEVRGFPHIAQDTETHSCAESSLWTFMEFFGSKYPQYKPLLPSQIIKKLVDSSEHRILPSMGLTKEELAKCLHNNDYQCLVYPIVKYNESNPLFRLMRIYIESGIPLLLVLGNKFAGHAVIAIGHENNLTIYNSKNLQGTWNDTSFYNKKIVIMDDNIHPYNIADLFSPTKLYQKKELRDMVIKFFIVPLPRHMFLTAEKAYELMKNVLNDPKVGITKKGIKWLSRLLLTGSHSFKEFVCECDNIMDITIKKYLLQLALPRFIWICELYKENDILKECCSGLLIIDATGDNRSSLMPVLWYIVDDQLFTHNGLVWDVNSQPLKSFNMKTYKNNLKGE
jgi:hypothetical protein